MDARSWWRAARRDVSRTVARHRRPLAALATALAVLSGVAAVRPAPPPTEPVLVAARDLPTGTRLEPADLTTVRLGPATVPDGAYDPADPPVGRLVAAPVRRGEPLTDRRLVGPGLVDGLPDGQVLAAVHVPEATAWLVRPGDSVDVVAGATRSETGAEVVASAASVVAVPRGDAGSEGRPVVVALDALDALAVSSAALVSPIDLFVRGG